MITMGSPKKLISSKNMVKKPVELKKCLACSYGAELSPNLTSNSQPTSNRFLSARSKKFFLSFIGVKQYAVHPLKKLC